MAEASPAMALRLSFVQQYALLLALPLCYHMKDHKRFHQWLRYSSHSLQNKAGFGAGPCKAFGILSTGGGTYFMGPVFLLCLALVGAALPYSTVAAFGASLCFFSDTFCETTAGSHAPLLVPFVLLYSTLSPSEALLLHLVRTHVASAYVGAALSKLALSFYFRRNWLNGDTLQYYIFEAAFKVRRAEFRRWLQRYLVRRPRLLALLSVGSLLLELSFGLTPLLAHRPHLLIAAAVAALSLHLGIHLTLGVDFLSYWCPALLAFALPCEVSSLHAAATATLSDAPLRTVCALSLLAVQILHVVSLHDIRSGVDDRLPFSCFPLYALPRSLNDGWPHLFVLTSANLATAGHLDPFYHHPGSSAFTFTLEEMRTMQERRVVFGCAPYATTPCRSHLRVPSIPPEVASFVRPDLLGSRFCFYDTGGISSHGDNRTTLPSSDGGGQHDNDSSGPLRASCERLVRTISGLPHGPGCQKGITAGLEQLMQAQEEVLKAFRDTLRTDTQY
jgi:hypothetical protein